MIQELIAQLLDRHDLTREQAREAMHKIMRGDATQAQIAGYPRRAAREGRDRRRDRRLRRGDARARARRVEPKRDDLVDTAGTGGDGANTCNISTAAALVAAAAGAGDREARQPRCVVGDRRRRRARGARLRARPAAGADRAVDRRARLRLPVRTGAPSGDEARGARPARAGDAYGVQRARPADEPGRRACAGRRRLLGCADAARSRRRLCSSARERAYVVHGAGGIDELSPSGPNLVCEVEDGGVREYELDPLELGIERCDAGELRGGDPAENAAAHPPRVRGRGGRPAERGPAQRGRRDRRRRTRGRPARRARARARGDRLRRRRGAAGGAGGVLARHEIRGRTRTAGSRRRSPRSSGARLRWATFARTRDPSAARRTVYARSGAAAISVLVDERFAGTIDDLRAARAATEAPLLGKGFFSTEEHLRELRDAGADAALLILRDLDDATTAQPACATRDELGLDALVEAHDADELRACACARRADHRRQRSRPVDVRRSTAPRNLRSSRARRATGSSSPRAAIHTRAQGAAAELAGADAVLVGTALMQAPDPGAKLRELLSRPLVKVCGLTRQEDVDAAVEAGADLLGFILVGGARARAPAVLDVPDTVLSVAVFVGEPRRRRRRPRAVLSATTAATCAGARRCSSATASASRACSTSRGRDGDPSTGRRARDRERTGRARRRSRPRQRARRDRGGASVGGRRGVALERDPAIKDHDKVRAFVEAARCTELFGDLRRPLRPGNADPRARRARARLAQAREGRRRVPRGAAPPADDVRGTADAADARRALRARASAST